MPGNALFSVFVFVHVCFSIWSPKLYFRAPKITLEPSKSIIFRKRVQGGLQRAFCIDFGSQGTLQEAFGIDFGTKWVAFGNVWEGVGEIFGRLWGSAQRTKVRCRIIVTSRRHRPQGPYNIFVKSNYFAKTYD